MIFVYNKHKCIFPRINVTPIVKHNRCLLTKTDSHQKKTLSFQ